MIRARIISCLLGKFLLLLSAAMLIPCLYALAIGDGGAPSLLIGASGAAIPGMLLALERKEHGRDLNSREAILLVFSVLFSLSLLGSLPFYFSPHFAGFTDSFFESVSGFTTTGATVLRDVEVLPRSLQLWRHLMQWLGGMGVVLLGIAVLPLIGIGGLQLYRAEFSGAGSERLTLRFRQSALSLWKIYAGLTVGAATALWLAGMPPFEALCHAFSTLSTGGFSTRNASIAAFNSPAIETVLAVFMLLAGMSYIQHYRLWIEQRTPLFADVELRWYFAICFAATGILAATLVTSADTAGRIAIRDAMFHASSMMTTTGFVTADFRQWYPSAQVTLLALMFIGGSTASTAGGLKTSRIILLANVVNREFRQLIIRRGVFAVRLGTEVVSERTIHGLLNLVYLAFAVNFAACLVLAALGIDVVTAIAAVGACMFNVGPGMSVAGTSLQYADMPGLAKWVLAICMIAGRLEFYSLFVIFTRPFWKR